MINDEDFKTLAEDVPFPASDIGADYSPVEKERITGPITRVLAALVGKGPLTAQIVRTDNNGYVRITNPSPPNAPNPSRILQRLSILPSTVIIANYTGPDIILPSCDEIYLYLVVTAMAGATPSASWFADGLFSDGAYRNLSAAGAITAPGYLLMYWAKGFFDPNVVGALTDIVRNRITLAAGTTSVTAFIDMYYR